MNNPIADDDTSAEEGQINRKPPVPAPRSNRSSLTRPPQTAEEAIGSTTGKVAGSSTSSLNEYSACQFRFDINVRFILCNYMNKKLGSDDKSWSVSYQNTGIKYKIYKLRFPSMESAVRPVTTRF
jgi:hypothetical protein